MAASLDANQQAADQVLLAQLSYKLPPTASYVLDRRASCFYTSGAGTFSPVGVRTFRVPLNSDSAWADLNTLTLSFTCKNAGALNSSMRCKTDGPWSLIHRLRILVSGTVVEDIPYYGRLHEQFYRLSSTDMKKVEGTRGFLHRARNGQEFERVTIAGGRTFTVSMKPLSGVLQCGRYFPIAWCPITVEVELAPADVAWQSGPGSGLATASTTCEISDARVNVDLVTLDSGLHEEFAKLMEGSGSLPLTITSFSMLNQAILGTNPVISLTRACSRIRDVMWSFTRRAALGTRPPEIALVAGATNADVLSYANDFYFPKAVDVNGEGEDADMYEVVWQLGAKILGPEANFRFQHEFIHELHKALGYLNDTKALPDIDRESFLGEDHICAVTLERALNVAMTGLSSRTGSPLTVQFRRLAPFAQPGGIPAGELAVDQVWVVILHEVALNLTKYGVVVAD